MKEIFKNETPIRYEVVSRLISEMNLPSVGKASIREIKRLIDNIERETGLKYIRMEMGIPGLKPSSIGNVDVALVKYASWRFPGVADQVWLVHVQILPFFT